MLDDDHAPVQCRQCGKISSYATKEGYRCSECDYLLTWEFFKLWKLKCGCEKCRRELQQSFWKKIPPFELGKDYQDFQI